jgi:hypothetical protein
MDSCVSPKDEIWFLRVCHHISTGLYNRHKIKTCVTVEVSLNTSLLRHWVEVTGRPSHIRFTREGKIEVPIKWDAVWVPEMILTVWSSTKFESSGCLTPIARSSSSKRSHYFDLAVPKMCNPLFGIGKSKFIISMCRWHSELHVQDAVGYHFGEISGSHDCCHLFRFRKRRSGLIFIVAPCISISIFQEKPTNALIFSVFKNTH